MPTQPRRPAMLDAGQAASIVGVADFTADLELAREIAGAVIGQAHTKLSRDVMHSLPHLQVEALAELWQDAPADTLPAALWRLYLVQQWIERDPETVVRRCAQGRWYDEKYDGIMALKYALSHGEKHTPDPSQLAQIETYLPRARQEVASYQTWLTRLWAGELRTAELTNLLASSANFLTVLAAGVNAEWILDPTDPLGYPVTLRPAALLATAEEFAHQAALCHRGKLN